MVDTETYGACRKLIASSLEGAGAIKGKDGTKGEDGKSAYEIAVENGYEGTYAEFGEGLANVTALSNETPSNINFGSEVVIDVN